MNPDAPITFAGIVPQITLEAESRTIRGTITAYNTPTTDYRRLVIHDGAIQARTPLSRVKLLIDHDQTQPVGFMTELDATATTAAFTVPDGEAGDKALADAKAGLRDGLSVGINVLREEGAYMYDAEAGTYHVFKAELVEVSLVAIPAYSEAGVTSVAAAHQTATPPKEHRSMDPETLTLEQVEQALSQHADEQDRRLEQRLSAFTPQTATAGPSYATFGAFVQAVAGGDDEALAFAHRLAFDADSAITADDYTRNPWVKDAIHLVEKQRRVINLFTREPLPAEGMTLEYARLKSNTVQVGKQAAQGADLPKGKVQLEAANTSVGTYGGYTEASIQVIKRANTAYLTSLFKAMGIEYAKATELAVRAVLNATIADRITAGGDAVLELPAAATAYDWLDLAVDASELYDDLGYTLTGAIVAKDVFKELLRLEDTNGNQLMRVTGDGVNRVGTIDVVGLKGDLGGINFHLLPGLAAGTGSFYDPIALTTWESPGAPFQLQDSNILNLTEAFSLYGFLAAASQFPNALVPITRGA